MKEDLGNIITSTIREAVKEEVSEIFEPMKVLKNYEHVEQLTIEEVCEVFRRQPNESSKNWVRERCRNGEIPHLKLGDSYYFPKHLLTELLTGQWRPEKKEKKKRYSGLSEVAREFVQ